MMDEFRLLGWKAQDRVSGFIGVVTHVGLDLFGCVQAIVKPPTIIDKDGAQKTDEGHWFDTARLVLLGDAPVMAPIPRKEVASPAGRAVAGADCCKPLK